MPVGRVDGRTAAWLVAAAVVAALFVVAIASRGVHVNIHGVTEGASSHRLEVGVASCNERPRIEVNETDTKVRLSAFVDRSELLATQDGCRDALWVNLQQPLGGREVIDTFDE